MVAALATPSPPTFGSRRILFCATCPRIAPIKLPRPHVITPQMEDQRGDGQRVGAPWRSSRLAVRTLRVRGLAAVRVLAIGILAVGRLLAVRVCHRAPFRIKVNRP
jgi:hypothetical protein